MLLEVLNIYPTFCFDHNILGQLDEALFSLHMIIPIVEQIGVAIEFYLGLRHIFTCQPFTFVLYILLFVMS